MHLAALERAVVFALVYPETATWATPLARGLTRADFTDPLCRVCMSALAAARRREDAIPTERDIVRRYSWCQRATALMPDVEEVETWSSDSADPAHHIPEAIAFRPITKEEFDELPDFLRAETHPGAPICMERSRAVEHVIIRSRPVDHLIIASDYTEKQIRAAFAFMQSHKRTRTK